MAYGDFKDLTRKTAYDKILRDKSFNIPKNPKHDECQRGLAMLYKFIDKKSASLEDKSSSGGAVKNENMSYTNQLLENFKKRKVYSTFTDYIWGYLADMQLISKFNKGIRFLLYAIDIFSKYAWVIPLKDKKRITITNGFQKILDEANRKLNKISVNKGSKLSDSSVKS